MTLAPPALDANPLREGLEQERVPDASCLVIFGASGDLTQRKLVPALYSLAHDGLLPAGQALIGFARPEFTDDAFRVAMREACDKHARTRPVDEAIWENFARNLFYVQGEFGEAAAYDRLRAKLEECDRLRATGGRRIYYLAVPPQFFPLISETLAARGMVHDPEAPGPYTRVIIEKPFGHDLESARELNRVAVSVFRERQVFRIDHYLGKETVQNLLVFRFANSLFEPLWTREHVDHVQITVAEEIGIGSRAGFYEGVGVVRDMLQNHLLQLLCLTAIEPPVSYDSASLRDETLKVLRSIRAIDVARDTVTGQYAAGEIRDQPVPGYQEEPGVAAGSDTRTFVAARLFLDNWRWQGVPFFLRTGKRMEQKLTEICIQFKPTPHLMFPVDPGALQRNLLVFRLAPQEGIIQFFAAKRPGPELEMCPVRMNFLYSNAFALAEESRAYAWLLRDVMQGDQTLFARADWIDEAWSLTDPIVEGSAGGAPLTYPAGSWGPEAADRLIEESGRAWREI